MEWVDQGYDFFLTLTYFFQSERGRNKPENLFNPVYEELSVLSQGLTHTSPALQSLSHNPSLLGGFLNGGI